MSPLLQCLNNCIEFLLIRGIISPGVIQFFTEIGYRPIILTQHSSNGLSTGITLHLKWFSRIRQNQHRLFSYLFLQNFKIYFCFNSSYEWFFALFYCLNDGCIYLTEVSYEFPIKTGKSVETSYLKNISG